ncbi:MAG: winged helix-turn-helix transcriptional regulator [Rhodospirillaceae bacterium]|jgi:DNA-binding MarR family transcriptional regulator|nr:winged helix-turn-helix transcriptional regulator [Rhodospirillaceae bacterium]MBT5455107.1 winged helix-turn-helix transcriptional regulator [Rhodospirillaceae bacterium]
MDLHAFENCTCFNLRKATRALTQIYDDALRPVGLRANQVAILTIAKAMGPIGMSELASALVMDRTTLTRNLKPLHEAGYLDSQPGEDKRRRVIALTSKGRRILAEAEPLWKETQTRIADNLGHTRWTRLLGDLSHVTQLA